ncbi:MAG: amidohydrolase [Candidatus Hydrogenedentes bacterium]|nr:amidohydrolase [Candidatus Hydrogenedentota bacterium]
MINTLKSAATALVPEVQALRHELHQHPEIRFEEHWTSDRIAQFLTENGIPHTRGHAKGTGIMATIEGTPGKTVALRADMDALEIEEQTGLPYASTIPDRMHACGHDGHSSMLCGAAKLLWQQRDQLAGTVNCIFQPAEEIAAGGRFIVEEGLLDNVDAAFALHCWPGLPCGDVAIGTGPVMASADFFRITVQGKGGHGANPGAAIDPIVVASHIITALQSIVSREIDPWSAVVVSVTRMTAGFASNVIPDTAVMEGTFRALSPESRNHTMDAITRIATNVAQAFRASAQVEMEGAGYPVLINDTAMGKFAQAAATAAFGAEHVQPVTHPYMTAEDFAYYLQKVPGAFIFLGNDAPNTVDPPSLHSPRFIFNDDALAVGMETLASVAVDFLVDRHAIS